MKYFIQQKVLKLVRNQFDIKDEGGNIVYKVKSSLSIPYKLRFYNQDNQVVVEARKRYFRFLKRYDIKINKKTVAIVKARVSVFSKKFKIISKLPELHNIKVQGDIIGLSFQLTKDGALVASIGKKFLSIGDKYSVELKQEGHKNVYLAIAIVLDDIVHKGK